jgi:hypothetical protein
VQSGARVLSRATAIFLAGLLLGQRSQLAVAQAPVMLAIRKKSSDPRGQAEPQHGAHHSASPDGLLLAAEFLMWRKRE